MSKQITIQQAREYFDLGVLSFAFILPVPMGAGWYVNIEGKSGSSWHLGTARGDLRGFATIDSAVNAVRSIGWKVSGLQVHNKEF